jgi:hypothetical protein
MQWLILHHIINSVLRNAPSKFHCEKSRSIDQYSPSYSASLSQSRGRLGLTIVVGSLKSTAVTFPSLDQDLAVARDGVLALSKMPYCQSRI